MKVLGLLKQKGGAGATTLAIHLALAAQEDGQTVALVDTDPQGSLSAWREQREASDPPVARVDADQLGAVLKEAEAAGVDLLVIDTPPHSSAVTAAVAKRVDLAVIPTLPGSLDLAALPAMLQLVQRTKTKAVVVLNACPSRVKRVDSAREVLEGAGVPLWKGQIGFREAFREALDTGMGVTELGRDTTATDEIRSLWLYLKTLL